MSWTKERIEELRQMWGDGLSASQIALALGSVSRNAVIGKIHRLGLGERKRVKKIARSGEPLPSEKSKERAAVRPAPKRFENDRGFYVRNITPAHRVEQARQALENHTPEEIPNGEGVPYGKRKSHQCCEILGSTSGDIRCCGKPVSDLERQVCAECAKRYSTGRTLRKLSAPPERNYIPNHKGF